MESAYFGLQSLLTIDVVKWRGLMMFLLSLIGSGKGVRQDIQLKSELVTKNC